MNYTQLPATHKYNTIAEAIYARELEFFHYDFDRVNFEYLLKQTSDPIYIADLEKRLTETKTQMRNVENIIAALTAQIEDQEMYQAAVSRCTAKREAVAK